MNVGTVDRVVRIGTGLALVGLAFAGTIGPWGYIGIVPMLTGFFLLAYAAPNAI